MKPFSSHKTKEATHNIIMIDNDNTTMNNDEGDGPLVTKAYVCHEKGAKLVLEDITLPSLTATQVEVDITHCG